MIAPVEIAPFLDKAGPCLLVRVVRAQGSTPRAEDAWMLVSQGPSLGTIGGGALEFYAMDEARQALAAGPPGEPWTVSVPLGPEIRQCCGGRVDLAFLPLSAAVRAELLAEAQRWQADLPAVFVFGAGHVGRALARALVLLPVRATVIDNRATEVAGLPAGVDVVETDAPLDLIAEAPPGSAFVTMTHSHALDFALALRALARRDAAYVGMIGSRTKRAQFARYAAQRPGGEALMTGLTCPIGAAGLGDKRPAVIASFVAADLMAALAAVAHRAPAQETVPHG